MPKRLVKKGVTVVRDGKRVRPEIGKNFDFTAVEIERMTGVDSTVLAKADSNAEDGTAEVAGTGTAPSSAEKSQAKAKGGKKKATANKSDAEAAGDDGEPDEGEGGGAGAGSDDDL